MPISPKILLLDDETDVLERYRGALSGLRSRPVVETCTSGAKAMSLLESENFSLLVTDLHMPGMDGLQVATIVRRKFPQLRLVVMTNGIDSSLRSRAYSLGVDLVWEKPGTKEELGLFQSCVESLLDEIQPGGFQGVQTKSLVDLVQLECLSRSSSLLRLTNGDEEGFIWIHHGEVMDAELGSLEGEAAFNRILRWANGSFEILPAQPDRARRIEQSWQGLLLNTAQEIDEMRGAAAVAAVEDEFDTALWHALSSAEGVEFVMSGQKASGIPASRRTAPKTPEVEAKGDDAVLAWAQKTWSAIEKVGQDAGLGPLCHVEGIGRQRHVGISAVDETIVCMGFNRKLSAEQVRATTSKIHQPA
jgi:CheY-like chemotaxis protein